MLKTKQCPSLGLLFVENEERVHSVLFVNGILLKANGGGNTNSDVYDLAKKLAIAMEKPIRYAWVEADQCHGKSDTALFDQAVDEGRFHLSRAHGVEMDWSRKTHHRSTGAAKAMADLAS